MTKAEATAPAKVPTKAEILEKLKQNDAKLPNTGQPIFELAQLDRSGVYWQFIGLCEQVEKLANADCSPDQKQAGIIELFKDFVSVEKQINEAKANAEQAKAERIRELQSELEHAKEVAGQYIDVNKVLIMPLFSESLLNDPREWTLAEITEAVCRDIETLRCHQWEAIGKKIATEFADQHPKQFPNAISRKDFEDIAAKYFAEVNSSLDKIGKDTAEIKKNQKTGKLTMTVPEVALLWGVSRQTIYNWIAGTGTPDEWPTMNVSNDVMIDAAKRYKSRREFNTIHRTEKPKTVFQEGISEKYM